MYPMPLNEKEKTKSESSTNNNNNNDSFREKQEVATLENNTKVENTEKEQQIFLNFSFFKVDPKWRWLKNFKVC